MARPPTPRELLASLESQQPVPFPQAEVERARALLTAAEVSAEALEGLGEPLALAVLEAQVRARRPQLAAALTRSPRKELAKAAKRALYQLKSSGVAVPEEPKPLADNREPEPAAAPGTEEAPSLLSAFTGDGERGLLLVRAVRGGLELAQAVLSDESGVVSLTVAQTSRGVWRRQLKTLRSAKAAPAIEVDLGRAKEELAIAAGRNLATRTAFPPGLSTLLAQLEVQPEEAQPPLPLPEPEDERRAYNGQALHDEPEIRQWMPSEPELRALAEKMDSVVSSPLELSGPQRSDQLLQAFRSAAQAYFTAPVKRLYARRLWAMGEFFERTGRQNAATTARAEARRLFHDAPGVPSRFAEFLFEKVLLMTAMEEATEAAARGLPAEPPPRPGGLILP